LVNPCINSETVQFGPLLPKSTVQVKISILQCQSKTKSRCKFFTILSQNEHGFRLRYCSVLFKWEFFIQMRASCLTLSFHQKTEQQREDGCKIGHSHLNEKLSFELRKSSHLNRTPLYHLNLLNFSIFWELIVKKVA